MTETTDMIDIADLGFAPIDVSRPATDQIAAELRAAILTMRLAPGQMLSENEVGQIFEASRTPVREAFARLRDEGLLETRPSRGTYISLLSADQTRSAQFMREALEIAIAQKLCQTGLPAWAADELARNLDGQRRAAAADDSAAFQHLDDLFHVILADATGFDRLKTVLVREKAVLDRLRVLSLRHTGHMARLLADHVAIVAALTDRDTPVAVAHVQRHLRGVLDILSGLVASNRDYFEKERT